MTLFMLMFRLQLVMQRGGPLQQPSEDDDDDYDDDDGIHLNIRRVKIMIVDHIRRKGCTYLLTQFLKPLFAFSAKRKTHSVIEINSGK